MSISINWPTSVIYIPKAYMSLVDAGPPEVRELDLEQFRLDLRDLEDDKEGMTWLKTHDHNTEVVLSGVTYARLFQILPPYSVTFEDGQYAVNAKGANTNIADVMNVNQVSLRTFNSAGLIAVSGSGGASADEIWEAPISDYEDDSGSTGEALGILKGRKQVPSS